MSTINDVARLANVSKATVSRYINNKNVSTLKSKAIESAIKELSFVPNKLAQSVSNKKSNLISIIVPDLSNPFFNEIVSSIEKEAVKNNINCLIFSSQNSLSLEQAHLQVCEDFNVLGVVLATVDNTNDVSKYQIPIVSIDRYLETAQYNILVDNFKIGQLAANYFIKNNVSNILYIEGDSLIDTTIQRREAFINNLNNNNIQYTLISSSYASVEQVYRDLSLIKNIDSYDGIYMGNETIALGLLKLGIDSKFIGVCIDGTYLNDFLLSSFHTIEQPIKAMALKAYDVLINNSKTKVHKLKIKGE